MWINKIVPMPADQRYQVRFISSRARRWQAASLHALRCFAVDLVQIDERD
jgi:hypothetical protein